MVWLIGVIPNHDAGIALVLVTLFVSLLLFSLSKKGIKTQLALKEIEPELKRIREEVASKEEQAKQTLALYKKHKVNPFSMILMIAIQFPILIALYYVFYNGFPAIHTDVLYSFVKVPETVNMCMQERCRSCFVLQRSMGLPRYSSLPAYRSQTFRSSPYYIECRI